VAEVDDGRDGQGLLLVRHRPNDVRGRLVKGNGRHVEIGERRED
jgi:hypothetical protein